MKRRLKFPTELKWTVTVPGVPMTAGMAAMLSELEHVECRVQILSEGLKIPGEVVLAEFQRRSDLAAQSAAGMSAVQILDGLYRDMLADRWPVKS